jgi:uncharacterized protein YfaS (alpha-2-macroglobulin family)
MLAEPDAASTENQEGITTRSRKAAALFVADIETDDAGRATVDLPIPDFAGRLRLMAVATNLEAVGQGEADVTVRDPVTSDVILPRFMAPGDEAEATLSVHNLSGEPQAVTVDLATEEGLALAGEPTLEMSLENGERRQVPIALTAEAPGETGLSLSLSGEGLGTLTRSWDLAVRPAQPYTTEREVAVLEPDATAELTGAAFEPFFESTARGLVTLSSQPDFDVPGLLDALNRYPYGCSEQTLSRILPLLYFEDVAAAYEVASDPADVRRKVESGLSRVLNRQRGDGAIAAWSLRGEAHAWLTAYAFDVFTRAREQDYRLADAPYELTLNWLANGVRNQQLSPDARAYMLYGLTRVGELTASDVRLRISQLRFNARTPLALGHLAAAAHMVGETQLGEDLFTAALDKQRPADTLIQDYGSTLRDRAALTALLAEAYPRGTRALDLAEAVEDQFAATRFFSTQDRAWLLIATHALSQRPGAAMQVSVNGEQLAPQRAPIRRMLTPESDADAFTVTNRGDGPIRFITTVRGVPMQAQPPASSGLGIARRIFRPDGTLLGEDFGAVEQGERFVVVVDVQVETGRRDHELLVADLLPAGFEIENAAITQGPGQNIAFTGRLANLAFEAARDDRYVAAFRTPLRTRNEQTLRAAYTVRAITPGTFTVPAPFVEDMYDTAVFARGAVSEVTITAP